jgi:hypothetical protein
MVGPWFDVHKLSKNSQRLFDNGGRFRYILRAEGNRIHDLI